MGTLALVYIGAGAVAVLAPELGSSAVVGIAFAHGLVLAIMVSNLGHISGGHFNPAVTASVWVAGKIETGRAAVYVGAQLVGAAIAAALRDATGRELNRIPVRPDDLVGLNPPVRPRAGWAPSPEVPGPRPIPEYAGLGAVGRHGWEQ